MFSLFRPTSKLRKKRFLGCHHRSIESQAGHGSKSYLTHGAEITRGNKENRSDALNRLLARRKRNKLSSLDYSSDEDEGDEFPVTSRRLSASLLQDSSGSELEDSPETEKSNESDVFGADDEFCMLSIEPKPQEQIKFNGEMRGLLPGGRKEMFSIGRVKSSDRQNSEHKNELGGVFKKDQKFNDPKVGSSAEGCAKSWINYDLNDSELPDLDIGEDLHLTGLKKKSPGLNDGNSFKTSPNLALPGNFYKKKFSHMFTNGSKKPAAGRLNLLSSSSGSDSESNGFSLNDADKMCSEIAGDQQESLVFVSSKTFDQGNIETKKRKYSVEGTSFCSKKRRSDELSDNRVQISPVSSKQSPPFRFDDSPKFPHPKSNGTPSLRRLSFEENSTSMQRVADGRCSDSDSDSFWKISLPSKRRDDIKSNVQSPKSRQKMATSTISSSALRLSPPAVSRSRMTELKVHDPVRLSVSTKSRHNAPIAQSINQSLEEGMHFTDESLRRQLQEIFGNDSDEELDWQPIMKKKKTSDSDERKSKQTKGNRYCVKKASGNKSDASATVNKPLKIHEKKMQPEFQVESSEGEDSDWEQKLQELVDDISNSSRRSKSGLALIKNGGKKTQPSLAGLGQKSYSTLPSFTRTSPKTCGTSTYTKPRNSSVSSFPEPNAASARYYDNRGLIRVESEELPKSVTLSSPPKLIKSVSSHKPKRRCRRVISNGSVIFINDSDTESSDDDVAPIVSNKKAMHLTGRAVRREACPVISPRIRELQQEDARNEFDAMLDPILLRELENELAPSKPKKTPKSRRGRESLDDPVEMVVEVTLDESIQREIQASLRARSSGAKSTTSTSTSRRAATSSATSSATSRPISVAGQNRLIPHSDSSSINHGLFTFTAGQSHQSSVRSNPASPPSPFNPTSAAVIKSSPRGRVKRNSKVTTRNSPSSPASPRFPSSSASDVIAFVPTSPALQASPRSRNRRSKLKTSRGKLVCSPG
jgi:hypothetical protein